MQFSIKREYRCPRVAATEWISGEGGISNRLSTFIPFPLSIPRYRKLRWKGGEYRTNFLIRREGFLLFTEKSRQNPVSGIVWNPAGIV